MNRRKAIEYIARSSFSRSQFLTYQRPLYQPEYRWPPNPCSNHRQHRTTSDRNRLEMPIADSPRFTKLVIIDAVYHRCGIKSRISPRCSIFQLYLLPQKSTLLPYPSCLPVVLPSGLTLRYGSLVSSSSAPFVQHKTRLQQKSSSS